MAGPYSGALMRRYTVDIPAEPGWADPARHRIDEGHRVDTSGRDEAPTGGGWVPMEYVAVQPPLPGGAPADFTRSHDRRGDHTTDTGGGIGDARTPRSFLRRLIRRFPTQPNDPANLDTAGAGGAAHAGQRDRGMDPSGTVGRRTVDGRMTVGVVNLGHEYHHPIEVLRHPPHLNRPRLRRVPAPQPVREQTGPGPGGYSSAYDPSRSARTAGPRTPTLRRLIRPLGQAETDLQSDAPVTARILNPGPIGNGGW